MGIIRQPTLVRMDTTCYQKLIMPFSVSFTKAAGFQSVVWNGEPLFGDVIQINLASIPSPATFGAVKSLSFSFTGSGYSGLLGFYGESFILYSPTSGQLVRVGTPFPQKVVTEYEASLPVTKTIFEHPSVSGCIPFFINQGASIYIMRVIDDVDGATLNDNFATGHLYAANYDMRNYMAQSGY